MRKSLSILKARGGRECSSVGSFQGIDGEYTIFGQPPGGIELWAAPVLASDIPANLEVGLSAELYFPLGNIEVLADRIRLQLIEGLTTCYARESTRM
ncbi:MAG: hypothetical protein PHD43_03355 [Methylococcales bacterium]|nr:hypothetical protein [Methylococcales bacterium]